MKKPLVILASMLLLCGAALWGNDFQDNGESCFNPQACQVSRPVCRQAPSCRPACPPPRQCKPTRFANVPHAEPSCKPRLCAAPPVEQCEPCRAPVRCHHPNQNELKCYDGITVTARNNKLCMLGDQYPLEFEIRACRDVCDVVVTSHLPEGVTYVRSQPEANVEGRTLTWDIGAMRESQVIPARVWLRCDCEGELCACFCATATPVRFCSILCAKPILSCSKTGPEEVCPGDPINYTISVTNRGSCAAEDVVVTDNVPDGLIHASCQRTLHFRLGTIEPCQTKKVNVSFTAEKRGRICNTINVTACNAEPTSCEWCTEVCKECVELTKTGQKEAQIGKNADYVITVTNPGDKPLTEVIVSDTAPVSTSIVAAPGACINGNHAVWKLRELQPGEKVSFNLTLTTCTPGCFTNRVNVTNRQGCNECAEFTTHWRGRPALNMQICDTKDPVCLGETTTYLITVVNQGSESDDNVQLVVHFPPQIEPVNASGDSQGQVSGATVRFAPFNNLRARQSLNYRIDGVARKSGDGRVVAELSSASITTPIMQQESTIVN